jgi:GNAT superfamily N-acetyltransferase
MYERRPYRQLPCFDGARGGVLAIGCLLVDTPFRRTGVPDALVEGAVRAARGRGAIAIEALPRRAEELRDEERWMGSFSTFRRAGFEIVHDFGPYPVLRLTL